MKNLAKIFMAVAVALFAFSCVQDATEELGVKVGGQTELTLSIEESRTQLGEKAGSLYPVTWCEGDVVAANGVASTGIEIVGNGTSATFTFPEAIARPWNVVYPATTATPVTEGLQAVTFLATQEYKVGTFCDGAAPMYGVAAAAAEGEAAPAVQLNHLSGVLRFAVKGAGEVLTSMTVTASGKIAGNFDVDCATGALTAHADATNVVTVTFGEGLTLGAEATPIYVAVPAGEHGGVTIVLTTADAKTMTLFFNSDGEKKIDAATVREFKEFTFEANSLEDKWFEIYTVADMLTFAKAGNALPFKGAKVMATIDMSGVAATEWPQIADYAKEFDGGKNEGFEIKGISFPLFYTIRGGIIKNVKLTDVNIVLPKVAGNYGSLVRALYGSIVENVEASGSISATDPTAARSLGGVIGSISGATTLTNVVNHCSVTMDVSSDNEARLGGIIGITATEASTLTDCSNYGAILVKGTNTAKNRVGGIVGYASAGGNITLTRVHNYGTVTVNNTAGADTHLAGMVGSVLAPTKFEDCHNHAEATVTFAGATTKGDMSIGGFTGYASNTAYINNCTNSATIVVDNASAINNFVVGGISGYQNNATAGKYLTNSSNSGNICINATNIKTIRLGGVMGYCGKAGMTIDKVTNTGNLEVHGTATTVNIGGIISGSVEPVSNATSKCNITYDASCTTPNIGGIAGSMSKKMTNCYSFCTIKAIGYKNVGMISGTAYVSTAPTVENCHLGGKLILKAGEVTPPGTDEDPHPQPVWKDIETVLSEGNFFQYIYGNSTTITEAINGNQYWDGTATE